jgi:hypothetical protein
MEDRECERCHAPLLNRPITDPIWPVFLATLAIGLAETLALACVVVGSDAMALRLDGFWFVGLLLSSCLMPSSNPADDVARKRWWDAALIDLTFRGWIVALTSLAAMILVVGSSWIFDERWATAIHGAAIGPYLLARCYHTLVWRFSQCFADRLATAR